MKERHGEIVRRKVSVGEALVTETGTLFQLRNDGKRSAEVLYVVSSAYAFEGKEGSPPHYDDGTMVARSWEELEDTGGSLSFEPDEVAAKRSLRESRVLRQGSKTR